MKIRISLTALAVIAAFPVSAQTTSYPNEPVLATTVVTATRQPVAVDEVLADVTVIDRAMIERSGSTNVIDLLARQPGIQFSRNGGPGSAVSLYVRGTNATQTKVLIDGVPINTTSLAGSPLQYFALNDVERIEIVRGAASALYGADAIGGVINVITRRGEAGLAVDAFAGLGGDRTRQMDFGVSGGDERWRFRVHGNGLRSDGFSSRKDAINRDADDDAYRNEGFGASVSFRPEEGHELGLSYREQRGRVQYDSFTGTGNFNDRVRFDNKIWRAHVRNRINASWQSTLSFGHAEESRRDYSFFSPAGDESRTRNDQWAWQNDIELPLGQMLAVVERFEQHAAPEQSFSRARISNNAVGLGWTAAIGPHSWQLNLRRDEHSRFGGTSTGAVVYGFEFATDWRISAGVSRAYKAPSIDELYNSAFGYGNPDLLPEDARNMEVRVGWDNGFQRLSATAYKNRIRNLVTYDFTTWAYDNIDRAEIKGVTLEYGMTSSDWDFRASYDWLDARNETTGFRLGRRAKNSLKLDLVRRFENFEIGGELIAAGSRYDTSNETGRLGGYTLLNLTASYTLTPTLRLEGRAENLTNERYELARGYNTQDRLFFLGIRYTPQ